MKASLIPDILNSTRLAVENMQLSFVIAARFDSHPEEWADMIESAAILKRACARLAGIHQQKGITSNEPQKL